MLDLAPADAPDLVVSSAMDLQVDLVNRGLAQPIALPADVVPPDCAQRRSELFGFAFETAAVVYDRRAIDPVELPRDHRDLARVVREKEARLPGRIGGYAIAASGIG
jgi:two-component system sensor histidine kinase TctE